MLAQQLNVEVISHNIANMNTTRFNAEGSSFRTCCIRTNGVWVRIHPTRARSCRPVLNWPRREDGGVYRIAEQGNLTLTENTLDLAINGEGYFQIELRTARPLASIRRVQLVERRCHSRFLVQPGLTIPDGAIDVTVNSSGEVLVQLDGQVAPQNIGQFELANFSNEAGLLAVGDNLYLETPASGGTTTGNPDSAGFGRLQQGFLETSNVNVVEEITISLPPACVR